MRAVITSGFGSGPVLGEMETPVPGAGEIRIKVRASSLNGFDAAMAYGYFNGVMEHKFPAALGRDYAGTVDQVGEGVTAFSPGDHVFGVVLTMPLHAGGFAEYLVIPEDHQVAAIPEGLDHAAAGVLGLAGAAATAAVEAVSPRAGDIVLVSGATGGVGTIAIQLAVARGAVVVATAEPGVGAEHVREYGAAYAVDFTRDVGEQIREIAPRGVDAVLHFAGDPGVLAGLLVRGGRFATLLGALPDEAGERGVAATSVYATPNRALLEHLAAEVVEGRLRVPVQRTYDLADVPGAFADFAAGTLGKLAVTVT